MKKILVVFVFLFSLGLVAQTSVDKEVVKEVISKADLPIGKTFAMLILDSDVPIVSGVIDKDLLSRLPIGRTFILSVDGVVQKYRLLPLPPREVSLKKYNIKNIDSYLNKRRNTFIRKQKIVMC